MEYQCLSKNRFENEGFALEPIRASDMESIRIWRNEQIAVLRQSEIIQKDQQALYYKEAIEPRFREAKPVQILFRFLKDGGLVGYGGLTNLKWETGVGEVSFLLSTDRTKDLDQYTREFGVFLELLKKVAFEVLELKRIFTETFDIRPTHIQTLEAHGFKREKRLKDHVQVGGERVDSLVHGISSGAAHA